MIEAQIEATRSGDGGLLRAHQEAVQRLAAVPGLGVDSAQQIIAEVGPTAATFPSAKHLASWVGACPGDEESAGVNYSHRSPKGNRQMRRLLNQAANAAVKTKGSIFELVYRRLVPRLGHPQAIGAIAHRLCRLIWKILHQGVTYEERGPAVNKECACALSEDDSRTPRTGLPSRARMIRTDVRPWFLELEGKGTGQMKLSPGCRCLMVFCLLPFAFLGAAGTTVNIDTHARARVGNAGAADSR